MTNTYVRAAGLAVALVLAPSAAYAVNVSSNDGNGEQHAIVVQTKGKSVYGNLRSTSGHAVYYSGKVDLSACSDPTIGRYMPNVATTNYAGAGGDIVAGPSLGCGLQGVHSRVCRDVTAAPDPCGDWSTRY